MRNKIVSNIIASNIAFLKITLALTLVVFVLASISGCQSVNVRGQYIGDEVIDKLNSSRMTKMQVDNQFGSPTYVPQYSQNVWYYIQRSQTKRAWFNPKVVDQRIVKVVFDEQNVVRSAELVENTHDEGVVPNSAYTETRGTEKSGIQKFVGNIGRFNKSSASKKKKK